MQRKGLVWLLMLILATHALRHRARLPLCLNRLLSSKSKDGPEANQANQSGTEKLSVFLDGLNEAQKSAVQAPINAASLCVAGPGSGKTKVLTHRIGYLLSELKQNPGSVLAITFTNKAAGEMKQRLFTLLGGERSNKCTLATFHSFSASLLRSYGGDGHLGRITGSKAVDTQFTIWDQDDALKTIKELMKKELGGDDLSSAPFKPNAVLNAVNKLREAQVMTSFAPEDGSSLVDTAEYEALLSKRDGTKLTRMAESILPHYLEALYSSNALDFEDLLLTAYKLLNQVPEVLERVRQRYRHILVDEYQDTNIPQYEIVRKLAPQRIIANGLTLSAEAAANEITSKRYDLKSRSLFAVGDRNQAIYSWRGARPSNMQSLAEHYPGLTQYNLLRNYRSTKSITDVANGIIGEDATTSDMTTSGGKTRVEPVRVIATADDEDQAECIATLIETLKQGKTAMKGEYAVMYRTNSQSRVLEQVLVERGVKYRLLGGRRFYDRREVRDVLCFLRVIANPMDANSLQRAMRDVAKGCGKKTVESFFAWTQRSAEEAAVKALGARLSVNEALPSPPSPLAHLLQLLIEEEEGQRAGRKAKNGEGEGEGEGDGEGAKTEMSAASLREAMALGEDASYVSKEHQLTPRERKVLLSFASAFFSLYQTALGQPLSTVIERALALFVTPEYLLKISKGAEEAADRTANVNELLVAAEKYSGGGSGAGVGGAGKLDDDEDEDEDEGSWEELPSRSSAVGDGDGDGDGAGAGGGTVAALPSGSIFAFLEDASLLTGDEASETSTTATSEKGKGKGVDPRQAGMVYLMTIHASKGLEFDSVFVTGLEEGCLPITRERDGDRSSSSSIGLVGAESEAVQEERRLAFVAVTRAKRLLFLTHRKQAQVFAGGGIKWVKCKPSRFLQPLKELPKATVAKMRWTAQ